ncbi:TRAP transporter large permease [Granulosicoccus antarcticus]|uniref:C4-dicarboxylate TRAP transporter large permease protein DctM n=1 Tax=Granulosicoccus antarcticus IMCC3135 TaxID=1192854 RepID=A0A2Z2P431_9GAMM|nr:TRAP transporter large permease subunit [Granulosicoccus antarcticus]ASJ75427.1 C4-dicarboxylate TRAP transporter large permease protein DctM [Granulosicoccus antarcticus IMCC3135]
MDISTVFIIILFLGLLAGILSGVPVMLVLLGVPLIIGFLGSLLGAFDLSYLQAFPQRVFGLTGNTLLIAVPLFIAMGVLLERSRTAERMLLVMARLLGGSARSLAFSVLVVSALIAASTGIIGATIVMLGLISLPAMTRAGLPIQLSSGLVCASGTLGQIIPPSVVLILLGDQISNTYLEAQHAAGNFAPEPVSVADLFAGALIPGLLLVSLYAVYVAVFLKFWSRRNGPVMPLKQPAGSEETVDEVALPEQLTWLSVLQIFMPPLLLILSVLGSILGGVATPTEAASIGAAGALLLAASHVANTRVISRLNLLAVLALVFLLVMNFILPGGIRHHEMGLTLASGVVILSAVGLVASCVVLWRHQVLQAVLRETTLVSAMVFGIIIGASMLSLVFRGFGGDELIEHLLSDLPGGQWGTLLVVMLVVFLLGFVLEFVEIIFIVVPIVGPILLASDFDPVWIAILLALNLQTSFLTPPFGFALFYFRSVAPPSLSTLGIYRAVIPFVVLQLLALCLVALFPQLATWLPALLI